MLPGNGTWYTASFRFCEIASYYSLLSHVLSVCCSNINIMGLKIPYSGKICRIGFQ